MKTDLISKNAAACAVLAFCAGLFVSCASTAKKNNPVAVPPRAEKAVIEILPANEMQKKMDEELRPVFNESFGEVSIVSAISSDNLESGVGGWMNYSIKAGIDQQKTQAFEKQLKKKGFIVAQNIMTVESGRFLFNMIVIKELPGVNYNMNIGALPDEENVVSVFVTAEKIENETGSDK